MSRAEFPNLSYLDQIDSTNLELARRYSDEAPEFTCLVSGEQTAGQGRLGRSWVSEPGASLSLSVLLRPSSVKQAGFVTLLAANAVHRALGRVAPKSHPSIKWPNDVLIGERKICGILAQLQGKAVILGIGVNLKTQPSAPPHAVALDEFVEPEIDQLVKAILTELKLAWQSLETNGGFAIELDYLKTNSATLGKRVRAELPGGEEVVGQAISITEAGHLVVQADKRVELAAADVWHLRD